MLLRQLYYMWKIRTYNHESPPDQVRDHMYQRIINAAAEDPTYDISADSVDEIPVRSDERVRRQLNTGPHQDVHLLQTGGMTGPVRLVEVDQAGYDWMSGYTLNLYRQLGFQFGDTTLVGIQEDKDQSLIGNWMMPYQQGECYDEQRLIELINHRKPEFIQNFPHILMAAARSQDLEHSPKAVMTFGAVVSPTMRSTIEKEFDAPLIETYGSVETGRIAINRGDGFETCELLVDAEYPEGIGQPIVTNLVNKRTPILRYELPDLVKASEGELEHVLGRKDDVIETDDGPVYPRQLSEAIYSQPEVISYQVIVPSDKSEIDLRLRARAPVDDEVRDQVERIGLRVADINHHETPFPITSGGKKRVFL